MTNNFVNNNRFADLVRNVTNFFGNLFVSSSTKEFNRLKNFIAS
ncbi:MAG TPA: hypothetical protein PKC39_02860 [Ferruginibacter sp.]|nr:hypothetical protein [Ferruginibacter sp.]HMP19878.1 hypothetical protein [Ferruginibacter sp.]